jgi:hypothetical protein
LRQFVKRTLSGLADNCYRTRVDLREMGVFFATELHHNCERFMKAEIVVRTYDLRVVFRIFHVWYSPCFELTGAGIIGFYRSAGRIPLTHAARGS